MHSLLWIAQVPNLVYVHISTSSILAPHNTIRCWLTHTIIQVHTKPIIERYRTTQPNRNTFVKLQVEAGVEMRKIVPSSSFHWQPLLPSFFHSCLRITFFIPHCNKNKRHPALSFDKRNTLQRLPLSSAFDPNARLLFYPPFHSLHAFLWLFILLFVHQ